jgi:hypothetical protein
VDKVTPSNNYQSHNNIRGRPINMSANNNTNSSGLRRSTRERKPVKYYGGKYEEPSEVVTDPVANNPSQAVAPESPSQPESPEPASALSEVVSSRATSTWVSRPGLGKLKTRKAAQVSREHSHEAASSEVVSSETVTPAAASAEVPGRRVLVPKTRKIAKGPVRGQPSRKTKTTQEEEPQEPESSDGEVIAKANERSQQEAALALLELSRSAQLSDQTQESTMRDTIYTTVDDDVLSAATILNGMKVHHDDSAIQSKMAKMLQHHRGELMDMSSGRTTEELADLLTPPARPKPFPQDLRNPYNVTLSYKQLGDKPPK